MRGKAENFRECSSAPATDPVAIVPSICMSRGLGAPAPRRVAAMPPPTPTMPSMLPVAAVSCVARPPIAKMQERALTR